MDPARTHTPTRVLRIRSIFEPGSLTAGSSFALGYLAQSLHLFVSTSINIIVPLALGPPRYAIVIALTAPGYLAPIVVDQFLNTRLAFDAGAGNPRLLGGMAFLKLIATGPAVALVWLIFSRSLTALIIGFALAVSFGLSTLLDAWLLATARSVLLVLSKVVLLILMTGATLIAVHRGPLAVAVAFAVAYSASGAACLALAIHEKGWRTHPRVVLSWRTAGLSGPMLWQATYSWLIPLVLVSRHAITEAANYKLAVGVAVVAFTLTPVPSLLVVAIAGRAAGMIQSADAALRRAVILATAGALATTVSLALNAQLLNELLARFKYHSAVLDSQVICLAVFPLLVNPLLTARLYSIKSYSWGPVVLFGAIYAISMTLVAPYPGIAAAVVPLGQWCLFLWLALRNGEFLPSVRKVVTRRWAAMLISAAAVAALVGRVPQGWIPVRAVVTAGLIVSIVAISLPYIKGAPPSSSFIP